MRRGCQTGSSSVQRGAYMQQANCCCHPTIPAVTKISQLRMGCAPSSNAGIEINPSINCLGVLVVSGSGEASIVNAVAASYFAHVL
jgi:hypothetical protein